jgi:hypothetical protein
MDSHTSYASENGTHFSGNCNLSRFSWSWSAAVSTPIDHNDAFFEVLSRGMDKPFLEVTNGTAVGLVLQMPRQSYMGVKVVEIG